MKEIARAAAIVSDSALKNAPVTPDRNASGAKITSVAALDPASGCRNSTAARATWPAAPASPAGCEGERAASASRRSMCSIITIASSMM